MPETERWLKEYGNNRVDIRYQAIYWVAVLTLILGTVGILWSLPIPPEFTDISPLVNWGSCFLMATAVYYFIISIPLAIGMLLPILGIASAQYVIAELSGAVIYLSTGLTILSIVGLYLGHRRNSGFRAVLDDVQFMMIAPIWMLSKLYKRFGIPY